MLRQEGIIPTHSSRIIACDPSRGSSAFGIVVTDFRDGRICVLHADEYSNEMAEKMVDLVRELYYKFLLSKNCLLMARKSPS